MKNLFTLLLFTLPLAIALPLGAEEIVIQNGLRGYNGASDTTLFGSREELQQGTNGAATTLKVAGVAHGGLKMVSLIQFSQLDGPGGVPSGRKIKKATLCLYKVGQPKDSGQYERVEVRNRGIRVYPLLTAWAAGSSNGSPEEGAASFALRAYRTEAPDFWGDAFQFEQGPVKGIDYSLASSSTAPFLPENEVWMEWDVTSIVQQWVDAPTKNHGLYLSALSFYVGAWFASCEVEDPTLRPKLLIDL